jgi:nucleoside-diphosphate-sugar epimerase
VRRSTGTVLSCKADLVEYLSGRRVLVTGATGFIGWHLSEALVGMGAEVHSASRTASSGTVVQGSRHWPVDLGEFEATKGLMAKVRPQLIYHLAGAVTARTKLDLVLPTLRDNLVGTVHLLLAATEIECDRILIVGSSEEPRQGLEPRVPGSPYAAAKAAASLYATMFHGVYGLPVVVIRLSMTYGPRQEATKLVPYAILALLGGEYPKLRSGDRVCDFIYVKDVVSGLLRAGIQPGILGEILELGTGRGTAVREMVDLLVEQTGPAARIIHENEDRPRMGHGTAEIERAQRLLNWQPRWSLWDGLGETLAWYRPQPGG